MGQVAVRVEGLTHGYGGDLLFEDADLVIERGERVAIIGPNGAPLRCCLGLGAACAAAPPALLFGIGCCLRCGSACAEGGSRAVACWLQPRGRQWSACHMRAALQLARAHHPQPPHCLAGAGKSTLLRLLMGREKAQEGTGQ